MNGTGFTPIAALGQLLSENKGGAIKFATENWMRVLWMGEIQVLGG